MLRSLDEPPDPHGLNDAWYDQTLPVVAAFVPVVGLASVVGSLEFYVTHRHENPFNLAESARKVAIIGIAAQLLYGLTAAVIAGVA